MDDGIEMIDSPTRKRSFSPVMKHRYESESEEERIMNEPEN